MKENQNEAIKIGAEISRSYSGDADWIEYVIRRDLIVRGFSPDVAQKAAQFIAFGY